MAVGNSISSDYITKQTQRKCAEDSPVVVEANVADFEVGEEAIEGEEEEGVQEAVVGQEDAVVGAFKEALLPNQSCTSRKTTRTSLIPHLKSSQDALDSARLARRSTFGRTTLPSITMKVSRSITTVRASFQIIS